MYPENKDPKKRLIMIALASKKKSIDGFTCLGYMEIEDMKKNELLEPLFDSKSVNMFYSGNKYIDSCMYIFIHDDQRRMGIAPKPASMEEAKDRMIAIAASVGIKLSCHEVEENAQYIASKQKKHLKDMSKVISKQPMFLYSLIHYWDKDLDVDPMIQLEKIKERLLHEAAMTGEIQNLFVGSFLQAYTDESMDRQYLFKIAKEFGRQLNNSKVNIPSKLIPKTYDTILIEFPFTFEVGGYFYKSVFLKIIPNDQTDALSILAPKYDDKERWAGEYFNCSVDIRSSDDVEKSFERVLSENGMTEFNEFIKFCLKCYIYVYSHEPDLNNEKAKKSSKANIRKIRKDYRNICPFDLTIVGFGFHGRHYTKEGKYVVSAHGRWQPCGPRLSKVKYIIIEEHERSYPSSNK